MFSKRVYLRKEIREESLHKIVSYLDNKLQKVVNSAKKYIEYGKTWS